ncbi:MAG TPA: class I SAM-dependent methyltransferase [bacterium (Candidatus Stahlbacteria)]|nr:class I SAM-dependent methyltransferase [Candidatus Stahlbacteria bacterium]
MFTLNLPEKILVKLSKDPDEVSLEEEVGQKDNSNLIDRLNSLKDKFGPLFLSEIRDKDVLEVGCGEGRDTISLACYGSPKSVTGMDIREKCIFKANLLSMEYSQLGKASFVCSDGSSMPFANQAFDIIFTKDCMEHFPDPDAVMREMIRVLKIDGKIFITFGPPWFHPYGSHCDYFLNVPWANLLFSERTVMSVRGRFRGDGAKKYSEVDGGLNKMTVRKFKKLIKRSDLKVTSLKIKGVKNLGVLTKIPILNELFSSEISCVLEK